MDDNLQNDNAVNDNYDFSISEENNHDSLIDSIFDFYKNSNNDSDQNHFTMDTNFDTDHDYEEKIKEANESIIKNVNHWFLVNIISPEIQKNEEKKRIHKKILLCFVVLFLILQFGFLGYLIYWVFNNIFTFYKTGIVINDSTVKIFFTFVSGYITSIVVELIAMLRYIVKNVFDTSVSGLANAFKENNNKPNSDNNTNNTSDIDTKEQAE